MIRILSVLTLLFVLSATAGRADENAAFHAAAGEAYGGYRAATSYLRTGNPGLASLEIATALDAWQGLMASTAAAPPPAFQSDPAYNATVKDIEARLKQALALAEEGDTEQAAATLGPVRGMLYDLRKRNGIRLYADCITELNRAVEPLYKHRHDTPDLSDPDVRKQITAESRTYADLLADCRSLAPKRYTEDEEFVRLFDGTRDSIQSMFPAIDSGDPVRVVNVLRELRSFDRIIYFRFGG